MRPDPRGERANRVVMLVDGVRRESADESQFDKVNADPKRQFKWPTPTLPDGAVRDY